MTNQPTILRFRAYRLSLDIIEELRPVIMLLESRDGNLSKQLVRAATSVSLNLAESRGRRGRDRVRFLRIALGSAEESLACLHVAAAWGYVDAAQTADSADKLAHLLAMLGKMTRA